MELHGNTFKKGNDTMSMAPLLPAPTQGQCWTFALSSSTPPNPSRSEALRSTQSPWSTSTGSISIRADPKLLLLHLTAKPLHHST